MSDEVQVGQVWASNLTGDQVTVEVIDGRHVTHRGKRVVHTERANFLRKYTRTDDYSARVIEWLRRNPNA